jgi:hypothetical protein
MEIVIMAIISGPITLASGLEWWYWFYAHNGSYKPGDPTSPSVLEADPSILHIVARPMHYYVDQWSVYIEQTDVVVEMKPGPVLDNDYQYRYSYRVKVKNPSTHGVQFHIAYQEL